jgi:hypothetical protein
VATYRVLYWKAIPALVEAEESGETVRIPLSQRFQDLIDALAMRQGLTESQAYLDGWQPGSPSERPGSARSVAEAVAGEIEATFDEVVRQALPPPTEGAT